MIAIATGHYEAALCLLRQLGAHTDTVDNGGNTYLHHAVQHCSLDDVDFVSTLVHEFNCNINARNHDGQTVLHIAISRNSCYRMSPLTLWILVHGGDVNIRSGIGLPLSIALQNDNCDIVRELCVNYHADTSQVDDGGGTILHYYIAHASSSSYWSGDTDDMILLLVFQLHIDIHAHDKYGCTASTLANGGGTWW